MVLRSSDGEINKFTLDSPSLSPYKSFFSEFSDQWGRVLHRFHFVLSMVLPSGLRRENFNEQEIKTLHPLSSYVMKHFYSKYRVFQVGKFHVLGH